MFRGLFFLFLTGYSILFCSCNNDLVIESNLETKSDTLGELNPYADDFEPLISIDSLNKIEEELNKKLEEFEQKDRGN